MPLVRMEVNAELSPSLQWYCVIAEIPSPHTIEVCVVYNCAIFELCIELKNYHILKVSIRLQVDDHPEMCQHDAADTEDNEK